MDNLYVALIHHPVVNRKEMTVGSALTTIDIHDIARACRTFDVRAFYIVTPFSDQANLAHQVMDHWIKGVGGELNPSRKQALERVRVAQDLDTVCQEIEEERKQPVVRVATSAKGSENTVSAVGFKAKLTQNASHVLVFGTAWGLAQEVLDTCDMMLDPILGPGSYNHLSVRSAASIYLDRITNG